MKKLLSRILSIVLTVCLGMALLGCNPKGITSVEDFYEFDVSSIRTEQLLNTEQVISPLLKNLGETIADAKYTVSVKKAGADVTAEVYTQTSKTFAPGLNLGEYVFSFTALKADGNRAQNAAGEPFVKNVTINVVAMNFEPKASPGKDVTVNNEDLTDPLITFGESYTTDKTSSNQYRVTGVTFEGDYKIVYNVNVDGINPDVAEPKILFGIDRSDALNRDDNIFLNFKQGVFGCWFFIDNNQQVSGDDWTGTGWKTTNKSVSDYAPITGDHTVAFVRIIDNENAAHYVIEYDGVPFTTLNIKNNYTDRLRGIWIESEGIAATVGIESFENLSKDTVAPQVTLQYPTLLAGESFDLKRGVSATDNSGYGAFASTTFVVKDSAGKTQDLIGTNFAPEISGVYDLTVSVKDIAGNSIEKNTKLNVDASFGFGNFGESLHIKQEITFAPTFYSASVEEKNTMKVKILKNQQETDIAVTGNANDGFKFTIQDGGMYSLQATMTVSGKEITKQLAINIIDLDLAEITVNQTTDVARVGVGHILYYAVNDLVEGDKTNSAVVSILKGADTATAIDVTSTMLNLHESKMTAPQDKLSFYIFRPATADTYWMKISYTNENNKTSEALHKITANNTTEWVYGNKLDMGNGNPGKFAVGRSTIVYDGVNAGDKTSKFIIDNLNLTDNWTMKFSITDLSYTNQGKFFATLGMKPGWTWDDITIGGNAKANALGAETWGFETNLTGAGWQSYQWRGTWGGGADVTHEFDPIGEDGKPVPFREAPEYDQYITGTHEYKIECRTTATQVIYYYYIDGRPEARHVLEKTAHPDTAVGCVVLRSESMNGIVTNISVVQD